MNSFNIEATYWPRRKGVLLWAEFDRGEVRDELQQLATLGVNTLRLPLHWEDFQPRPERVISGTLRSLEQALDLASSAGLRVVPGLLPLAIGGAIHLPAWATAASFAADMLLSTKFGPLVIVHNELRPPLVWERTQHQTEVRDLWTNPAMRTAQRKLIAEVVGYFADHPVLHGWEIGSGIELARPPASADAAGEWLGQTVELLREHGARGPLRYTASLRSLVRREGPRPEIVVEAGAVPGLFLMPPEPVWAGDAPSAPMAGFTAALVRSLCGVAPTVLLGAPAVANAGNAVFADRAYGRAVEQPLLDPDAYANLVEAALPALQSSGAPGGGFAHAFCYAAAFVPEGAHSRREQMMGLVDTDGDELPVGNAVQRFAAQTTPTELPPFAPLDVEDYWNDPQRHFRRLWQQWTSDDERDE